MAGVVGSLLTSSLVCIQYHCCSSYIDTMCVQGVPHKPPVYCLQDEEHAYIVQELCAGGNLKGLLDQKGCISEVETANVMRGVLDVLVECHRRSICYGDLKVCCWAKLPAVLLQHGHAAYG